MAAIGLTAPAGGERADRRRAARRSASDPAARLSFLALLVFVLMVYSNPGNLFFAEAGDLGIAKVAAAAALAALAASWLLFDRRLHLGGAAGGLLVGLFGWIGASAFWSLWPSLTVDFFIEGLKYLAIFFVVANAVDRPRRAVTAVHVLAWASVIPAVGTIQSWLRGEHLVDGDRAAWIGIFANPNDLAYYLAIGVALALGGRELARRRLVRIAYLGALALMIAALFLTQSRGGLIATGAVFGLWLVRGLHSGRAAIGVVTIAALAIYLAPTKTVERAETTLEYEEDASAQGRIDAWRTGLNAFYDRPLIGIGAGAFALSWAEYAPGDAGPARSAHNTFIQLLSETGLIGLALFVGALGTAVMGIGRAAVWPELSTLARTTQVGLGGFAVASLTVGLSYSWPIYFLLGLATALRRIEQVARKEGSAPYTPPAEAH